MAISEADTDSHPAAAGPPFADAATRPVAPLRVPDHRLLRMIGRGSYGEVWLALNIMGTARAVKFVAREHFEQDRPFEREFDGLLRYEPISRSHEGLVNILHMGRDPEARRFYYVMELADDANASDQVESYRPKTLRGDIRRRGRLPLAECITLAWALASALGHLHKTGLVHRDLKPSNIIYVDGRPKIADIGLVAASGDARSFVGTEGFIPPQGPGTPAADLYALGKVLYEALTGLDRLRFPQLPAEWLDDPRREQLIEFNEILATACATDPARRYASAEVLLADLALLQVGKSVRRFHGFERRLRAGRRFGALALALALLAAGGYVLAQRQVHRERDSRRRVEQAEAEARRQLASSRLAQARALRHSGLAGQRLDCLEVIAAAAREQPSLELRNEAIGALALMDARLIKRVIPTGASKLAPALDFQAERCAGVNLQGALCVWRMADGVELARLPADGFGPVQLSGFSRDGRYLAVLETPGRLAVWDLSHRSKALEIQARGAAIFARFAEDSRSVFWSDGPQPLRGFDFATRETREWPVSASVWRFDCSPDGRQVALAYHGTNLVEVLDLARGQIAARLPQPGFVQALRWHPTQALLATACADYDVHLWDLRARQERLAFKGHQNTPSSLAFHPTEELLVSSGWDGTTRLWDLRTGRDRLTLPESGDHLQFSADGRRLAMVEHNTAHLLVYETVADAVCRTIPLPISRMDPWIADVAFDPHGRWVAGADARGALVCDVARGVPLGLLGLGRVFGVLFEPDGRHLLTAGDAGLLRWPLAEQDLGQLNYGAPVSLGETNQPIDSVCPVAGGLAWTHFGHVHIQRDGVEIARLEASEQLGPLMASPDGRWLAGITRWNFTVFLWDTATWRLAWSVPFPGASRLAFSPDSARLILGTPGEFLFCDAAGGQVRHRLERTHTAAGQGAAAFSADGRWLALARSRTRITLHAYPSLRELASLEAPQPSSLTALAFDPAGRYLAAACFSNQIQLWNLALLRRQLDELNLDW